MAKSKRIFREWQHPRDSRGRFARRGSPEWVRAAAEKFRNAPSGLTAGTSAPGTPGARRLARGAKAEALFAQHDATPTTRLAPHQPTLGPAPRPASTTRTRISPAAKGATMSREAALASLAPPQRGTPENSTAGLRETFADGATPTDRKVVRAVYNMNPHQWAQLGPDRQRNVGEAVAKAVAGGEPGADDAAVKVRNLGGYVPRAPKVDTPRDSGQAGGMSSTTPELKPGTEAYRRAAGKVAIRASGPGMTPTLDRKPQPGDLVFSGGLNRAGTIVREIKRNRSNGFDVQWEGEPYTRHTPDYIKLNVVDVPEALRRQEAASGPGPKSAIERASDRLDAIEAANQPTVTDRSATREFKTMNRELVEDTRTLQRERGGEATTADQAKAGDTLLVPYARSGAGLSHRERTVERVKRNGAVVTGEGETLPPNTPVVRLAAPRGAIERASDAIAEQRGLPAGRNAALDRRRIEAAAPAAKAANVPDGVKLGGPWLRDDRAAAAGTFRRQIEIDGENYTVTHQGVGYPMQVRKTGEPLGAFTVGFEDWAEAAKVARSKADTGPADIMGDETPQIDVIRDMARNTKASLTAGTNPATAYSNNPRATNIALARQARIPVRGKSNEELAAALHAQDEQNKAKRAKEINSGDVGALSTQHTQHTSTPGDDLHARLIAHYTAMNDGQLQRAAEIEGVSPVGKDRDALIQALASTRAAEDRAIENRNVVNNRILEGGGTLRMYSGENRGDRTPSEIPGTAAGQRGAPAGDPKMAKLSDERLVQGLHMYGTDTPNGRKVVAEMQRRGIDPNSVPRAPEAAPAEPQPRYEVAQDYGRRSGTIYYELTRIDPDGTRIHLGSSQNQGDLIKRRRALEAELGPVIPSAKLEAEKAKLTARLAKMQEKRAGVTGRRRFDIPQSQRDVMEKLAELEPRLARSRREERASAERANPRGLGGMTGLDQRVIDQLVKDNLANSERADRRNERAASARANGSVPEGVADAARKVAGDVDHDKAALAEYRRLLGLPTPGQSDEVIEVDASEVRFGDIVSVGGFSMQVATITGSGDTREVSGVGSTRDSATLTGRVKVRRPKGEAAPEAAPGPDATTRARVADLVQRTLDARNHGEAADEVSANNALRAELARSGAQFEAPAASVTGPAYVHVTGRDKFGSETSGTGFVQGAIRVNLRRGRSTKTTPAWSFYITSTPSGANGTRHQVIVPDDGRVQVLPTPEMRAAPDGGAKPRDIGGMEELVPIRGDRPQDGYDAHGKPVRPGDTVTIATERHNRTDERVRVLDVGTGKKGGSALATVQYASGDREQLLLGNLVRTDTAEGHYLDNLSAELSGNERAARSLRGQPSALDLIKSVRGQSFHYQSAALRKEARKHPGPLGDRLNQAADDLVLLGRGTADRSVVDRSLGVSKAAPETPKAPTTWIDKATGRIVTNPGQVGIVRGDIVKADSDAGKAAVAARDERRATYVNVLTGAPTSRGGNIVRADSKAGQEAIAAREARLAERRGANLDKARAVQREMRREEIARSTEPKDNGSKIKALENGVVDTVSLYKTANAGPSGQRTHALVGKVEHTPDHPSGEFRIRGRNGEVTGWATRTPRNGDTVYAVHSESGDGTLRLEGWAGELATAADVLNHGEFVARGYGADARRASSGTWERYAGRNMPLDELELNAARDQLRRAKEHVANPNLAPIDRRSAEREVEVRQRQLDELLAERRGGQVDTSRDSRQTGGVSNAPTTEATMDKFDRYAAQHKNVNAAGRAKMAADLRRLAEEERQAAPSAPAAKPGSARIVPGGIEVTDPSGETRKINTKRANINYVTFLRYKDGTYSATLSSATSEKAAISAGRGTNPHAQDYIPVRVERPAAETLAATSSVASATVDRGDSIARHVDAPVSVDIFENGAGQLDVGPVNNRAVYDISRHGDAWHAEPLQGSTKGNMSASTVAELAKKVANAHGVSGTVSIEDERDKGRSLTQRFDVTAPTGPARGSLEAKIATKQAEVERRVGAVSLAREARSNTGARIQSGRESKANAALSKARGELADLERQLRERDTPAAAAPQGRREPFNPKVANGGTPLPRLDGETNTAYDLRTAPSDDTAMRILNGYSVPGLRAIARDNNVAVRSGASKPVLMEAILDQLRRRWHDSRAVSR